MTPAASNCLRCRCHGAPMAMPSALASLLRAITQPSLFDSTTTGRPRNSGWNTRSHDTEKLLQSTRASGPAMSQHADAARDDAPHLETLSVGNPHVRVSRIFRLQHDRAVFHPIALDREGAIQQRQHDAAVDRLA